MDNKKVASLLNKGMKFDSLKMLNETQIDTLYNALIEEQSLASTASNKVKELGGEVDNLRAKITDTIKLVVGEEDLEEDDKDLDDSVEKESGYNPNEGNSLGNNRGPSANDGYNNAPDGMDEGETSEEFKSKSQQKYFFAKCEEEGPKSKWCKMADEFAADTKNWKKLPEKVKNEEIRQIEESLVSLVKKYVSETMTKKDLMNLLEQPGTKEAPVKTPTRTKPERKTPYNPKHKPAPKAADTEVAPTRVKPDTKEKPGRKTPYQPKHKPAPKAGKKGLPEFLKFNTLNIQFRDEQED